MDLELHPVLRYRFTVLASAADVGTEGAWMSWAPQECMLPTAERPLREAEFDELFATRLRSLARPDPLLLRLVLDDGDEVAATTRDLVAREQACCALFEFELTSTPEGLRVDVRVPSGRAEVLDGLAAQAAAAGTGRLGSDAPR
jgi:hypothetical protein